MQASTTVAHWFSSAGQQPRQPLVHQLALLPEPAQPWCCWDLVCPEEAWAADAQDLPLLWASPGALIPAAAAPQVRRRGKSSQRPRCLMGLTRTQLREALQVLAAEHPAAHPFTLALLLEPGPAQGSAAHWPGNCSAPARKAPGGEQ